MTTEANDNAGYIAATRFGLGLRPGELSGIQADPKGWLRSQLQGITRIPAPYHAIPDSQTLLTREAEVRAERRQRMRSDAGQPATPASGRSEAQTQEQQPQEQLQEQQQAQRAYQRETGQERQRQANLRMQVAVETNQPFAERLLRFWSNHFTVAISGGAKAVLRTIAVPYENEAIRANLNTDFKTLLRAVEQHPAMLIYLDNNVSIGPNSLVGRRRDVGLNENLAREILELHSLGVEGGYTQADVTSLAKIITGWSVQLQAGNGPVRGRTEPGHFNFVAPMHEPGSHTLLGRQYAAGGVEQGEAALADIADHPATAKHIATKLARHFVADDPPASAIRQLEQVFLDTRGSLPALHNALIDLDAAWQPDQRKLKTPEELIVSTARALGIGTGGAQPEQAYRGLAGTLVALNQSPFSATSPAGWPDTAEHWGSPDALLKRIEWANQLAKRNGGRPDPGQLYPAIMPVEDTLQTAIARAESSSQGLALLLGSPQFQWR